MKAKPQSVTVELLLAQGVLRSDADELVAIGLPTGVIGHLHCRPELVNGSLVLAYDCAVPLVVRAGEVRALDGTDRLVNTSVLAFLRTVEQYARYGAEVKNAGTQAEEEQVAKAAVLAMKATDPGGFSNAGLYWPIVCEQIFEGNL